MSLRIANVLPYASWGEVDESLPEKGCGGRETALIRLSRAWAEQGHEVISFVPRESALEVPVSPGSLVYHPVADAGPALRAVPFDLLVSWEEPEVFSDEHVSRRQRDAERIMEMQVAHVRPEALSLEREVCRIAALSPWHERFLRHQRLGQEIVIRPNGVDVDRYPLHRVRPSSERGPRFVYSSSPDRGLARLLEAWPRIVEGIGRSNDPELHVCYGAESWLQIALASHNRDCDDAITVARALGRLPNSVPMEGVVYRGRVGQHELAEIQLEAAMQLYPADTMSATETGCVTLLEACAAGAVPVITDCDCLGEEFGDVAHVLPLPFDADAYAEAVISLWNDSERREDLARRGRSFALGRSWRKMAELWT